MPASGFDVLNAVSTLRARRDTTTPDDIALELATTREDVIPQAMALRRGGQLTARKRPDAASEFDLTDAGQQALVSDPAFRPT